MGALTSFPTIVMLTPVLILAVGLLVPLMYNKTFIPSLDPIWSPGKVKGDANFPSPMYSSLYDIIPAAPPCYAYNPFSTAILANASHTTTLPFTLSATREPESQNGT